MENNIKKEKRKKKKIAIKHTETIKKEINNKSFHINK
jgi:hypothetical protein